jgi:hypothetical protein
MVVMGHRNSIDDSGLFPESLPYLYIDMYNHAGCIYKLV